MTIQDPEVRRLLAASSTALRNMADGLEAILNNMEGSKVTPLKQEHSNSFLAPCASHPHGAPHLQDIDSARDDYSRGLSGRI